jgi:serine/threonine-protein kinase RsbW
MANYGYSEKVQFRVHLALEEAIVNAHKHGHQGNWSKSVVVRFSVSTDGVVAQVEDQGPGFDPQLVPDPLAAENLERPSGRGLLLMRSYLSGVCHNEQGNCICLCKHRSPLPPPTSIPFHGGRQLLNGGEHGLHREPNLRRNQRGRFGKPEPHPDA